VGNDQLSIEDGTGAVETTIRFARLYGSASIETSFFPHFLPGCNRFKRSLWRLALSLR
jgi:hypothetical protein